MTAFLIRGFIYLLAAIALGESIRLELELVPDSHPFTEFGYLQQAQSLFLFACTALLLLSAFRDETYRELATCMGLFFLVLLIRENDQPLELFLPHGSWKFIVIIPLTVLLVYAWKNRQAVIAQLVDYSRSFAFGVMISGMVVLTFSRLFGRKSFWVQLMGDDFMRMVKNVAEEGVETLALGIVFIAVVEFVLFCKRSPRTT